MSKKIIILLVIAVVAFSQAHSRAARRDDMKVTSSFIPAPRSLCPHSWHLIPTWKTISSLQKSRRRSQKILLDSSPQGSRRKFCQRKTNRFRRQFQNFLLWFPLKHWWSNQIRRSCCVHSALEQNHQSHQHHSCHWRSHWSRWQNPSPH